MLDYAAKTFGFRPHVTPPPEPAALPLPAPGTVTALLGPSGAGKTRALRALAARHAAAWAGPVQGRVVDLFRRQYAGA
jgi:ABC-type transport system involved in cytochrome bd biosynthesis fused ATPase/permease subunit